PIGVPVVTPSNTPDRMRTWSGSLRWLVKCEVPVRRRSMSAISSASLMARPGGQPSTTAPSAGPWLSPKVVTTKDLPKLLPDTASPQRRLQLRCGQQEHPATAALECQPYEGQLRKRAPRARLGIAHLNDQHALFGQMAGGIPQQHAHRVHAVLARAQRPGGLMRVFGGQTVEFRRTYIGRIADDDIVAAPCQFPEKVRPDQPHAAGELQGRTVDAR